MKYPAGTRLLHKNEKDIGFIINTKVDLNQRLVIFTGDLLPMTWSVDQLDQWVISTEPPPSRERSERTTTT